jgi:predicted dehydrogenase
MIRIGLVGAGNMGALHGRVITTSDRAELMWIAEPDRSSGERLAARFGVPWLAQPEFTDVDAIVIAAPTQFHHPIAMEALDHGLPMLVEKPVADDFEQCVELADRSRNLGIPLMCGLLERFNPALRTAMDIIQDPLYIRTTRHSPYTERVRTGVASDLLIHDIDIAIRLFGGPPEAVQGKAAYLHPKSDPTSEDVAEALVTFPNGGMASLSASRLSQLKTREYMISESDRVIDIDLLRQDITISRHIGDPMAADEDGRGYRQQTIVEIPVIHHEGEPLVLQFEHFLDLLDGRVDAETERQSFLLPHRVLEDAFGRPTARGRTPPR